MEVTILKVLGADLFMVREDGVSGQYKAMLAHLRNYCSSCRSSHSIPAANQMVGVRLVDGTFSRGVVNDVMQTSRGQITDCVLVDTGETVNVPLRHIYPLTPNLTELPAQALEISLYGLVPVTLGTDYSSPSLQSVRRRCDTYDEAARRFVEAKVKGCTGATFHVTPGGSGDEKPLKGRLVLHLPDTSDICLNDELITENFAEKAVKATGSPSRPGDTKLLPEVQNLLQNIMEENRRSGRESDSSCNTPPRGQNSPGSSKVSPRAHQGATSPDASKLSPRGQQGATSASPQSLAAGVGTLPPSLPGPVPNPRFAALQQRIMGRGMSKETIAGMRAGIGVGRSAVIAGSRDGAVGAAKLSDTDASPAVGGLSGNTVPAKKVPGAESGRGLARSGSDLSGSESGKSDGSRLARLPGKAKNKPGKDVRKSLDRGQDVFAHTRPAAKLLQADLTNPLTGSPANVLASSQTTGFRNVAPGAAVAPCSTVKTPANDSVSQPDASLGATQKHEAGGTSSSITTAGGVRLPRSAVNVKATAVDKTTAIDGGVRLPLTAAKTAAVADKAVVGDRTAVGDGASSVTGEMTARAADGGGAAGNSQDQLAALNRQFQALLSNTGGDSDSSQRKRDTDGTTEESTALGSVLVDARNPPLFFTSLDATAFHPGVDTALQGLGVRRPSSVQSVAWPSLARGHNSVCVAGSGRGKTLAYLAPLLTLLLRAGAGHAHGAMLVVLTSCHDHARSVGDTCRRILRGTQMRVVVATSGAAHQNDQAVELMNGCEVLVATPRCLVQHAQTGATSLSRAVFLVVDDADILMQEFPDDVYGVCERRQRSLEEAREEGLDDLRDTRLASQVAVMSRKWTAEVKDLVSKHVASPITALSSPLEMAVYCNTHIDVRVVGGEELEDASLEHVRVVLETGADSPGLVVVCCEAKDVAQRLHQSLAEGEGGVECAVVTDEMIAVNVAQVAASATSVLVCQDHALHDMTVVDVKHVVHVGLPAGDKAQVFGLRQAALRQRWAKLLKARRLGQEVEDPEAQCSSIVFVPRDTDATALRGFQATLRRMGREEAEQLEGLVTSLSDGGDSGDQLRPLCDRLQAFGFCRLKGRCDQRHRILSTDEPALLTDADPLPSSGEVKIKVTEVEKANVFWGRVLSRRAILACGSVGKAEALGTHFHHLIATLARWFNKKENRVRVGREIEVGDVLVIKDKAAYHRVELLEIRPEGIAKTSFLARVRLLDAGRVMTVATTDLLELPAHLHPANIPAQAVRFIVARIQPADSEMDWPKRANMYVADLIGNKVVEGRIALTLSNTIWLDPCVLRDDLSEVGSTAITHYVRRSLLHERFGTSNPQHLENLYAVCEGVIETPGKLKQCPQDPSLQVEPSCDALPEEEDDVWTECYMATINTPGSFFLHRIPQDCDYNTQLESLSLELNRGVYAPLTEEDLPRLQPGGIYLAKFPDDKLLYRCSVTSVHRQAGEVSVFYCDYGERETLKYHELRHCPPPFVARPFLALECCLAGVVPRNGSEWTAEDGLNMRDLLQDHNGDWRLLSVKVVNSQPSQYTLGPRYTVAVNVIDAQPVFSLGQDLIAGGLANGPAPPVLEVLPGLSTCEPGSLSSDALILAASVFQEQDQETAAEYVQELEGLLAEPSEPPCGCEGGCVEAVCKVYEHLRDTMLRTQLLETLYPAWSRCSGCIEAACKAGGFRTLCRNFLLTNSREEVVSICRALCLLAVEARYQESLMEFGCCMALCRRVQEEKEGGVATHLASALAALTAGSNPQTCQAVERDGAVKPLCSWLGQPAGGDCLVAVLSALYEFSGDAVTKRYVKSEGLHDLCKALVQSEDAQVVCLCLRLLARLADGNVDTKRVITNLGVIPAISGKRLLEKGVWGEEVVSACGLLQHSMLFMHAHSGVDAYDVSPGRPSVWDPEEEEEKVEKDLEHKWDAKKEEVLPGRLSPSCEVPAQDVDRMGSLIPRADWQPRDDETVVSHNRRHPVVHWSQNKTSVLLAVQLRGVTTHDTKINGPHLKFSTHLDVEYFFDVELFKPVVAGRCRVSTRGSEVLISLGKAHSQRWPRLLASTKKPPYLKIDCMRWLDSDSESEADDRPFLTRLPKRYLPTFIPKPTPVGYGPDSDVSSCSGSISSDSASDNEGFAEDIGV